MTKISKRFLRSIIDICFLKNNYFSQHVMMGNQSLQIKDGRNRFGFENLKIETTDTIIKTK